MEIRDVTQWVLPIVSFIIGTLVKNIFKKVDAVDLLKTDVAVIKNHMAGLELIKNEWATIKVDLTRLIVKMEHIEKSHEDLSVLRRDMQTIWKNIDKIKDQMFDDDISGEQ